MKMPYGKFKDKNIEEISSWYLKWIAENFDEEDKTGKEICLEADKEWQYREKYSCHII